MSLLYNNYQKIHSENGYASAELSEKNWNILNKMMGYMESFHISFFEMEVIKKDLIGTAKEAEIEDVDFMDKIGMSEKEFCDNLLKEGIQKNYVEQIVLSVRNMVFIIFILNTAGWLLVGLPEKWGIPRHTLWFMVIYMIVFEVQDCSIRRRMIYAKRWKRWIVNVVCFLVVWGMLFLNILMPQVDEVMLIEGKGTIVCGISCVLMVVAFLGNNYFWDRRSRKYNWE